MVNISAYTEDFESGEGVGTAHGQQAMSHGFTKDESAEVNEQFSDPLAAFSIGRKVPEGGVTVRFGGKHLQLENLPPPLPRLGRSGRPAQVG